jgi:hypothetical protein
MFKREAVWMLLAAFAMVAIGFVAALIVPSLLYWLRH